MTLIAFFFLAALADYLSVLWHEGREKRQIKKTAAISMLLETLGWLPIWFALTSQDWRIAAASILGSGLGTSIGLKKTEPLAATTDNQANAG